MVFGVIGIHRNAIHGADFDTLGAVMMTHAFGTTARVNLVNFLAHEYGLVWANWLADIAVDALVGDV